MMINFSLSSIEPRFPQVKRKLLLIRPARKLEKPETTLAGAWLMRISAGKSSRDERAKLVSATAEPEINLIGAAGHLPPGQIPKNIIDL